MGSSKSRLRKRTQGSTRAEDNTIRVVEDCDTKECVSSETRAIGGELFVRGPSRSNYKRSDQIVYNIPEDENTKLLQANPRQDRNNPCEHCVIGKHKANATAFCIYCAEYLCETFCFEHEIRTTNAHTLLIGDDIPTEKDAFEQIKEMTHCTKHPNKVVQLICEDHDVCTCIECARKYHRRCDSVREVRLLRSDPDSIVDVIGDCIDVINYNNRTKTDNLRFLTKYLNVVRIELNEMVYIMHGLLSSLKCYKIGEARQLIEEQVRVVNFSTVKGEYLIGEYTRLGRIIKTVSQYGSPIQISIVHKKICESIEYLENHLIVFRRSDPITLKFTADLTNLTGIQLGRLILTRQDSRAEVENWSNNNEQLLLNIADPVKDKNTSFFSMTDDDLVFNTDTGSDDVHDDRYMLSKYSFLEESAQSEIPPTKSAVGQTLILGHDFASVGTQTPMPNRLGIPLIKCPIRPVGTYNIRQIVCKSVCSIAGCVFLKDNIVLIDRSNCHLLLFNRSFAFLLLLNLKSRPLGMCDLSDDTVAVALMNKTVQRFQISGHKCYYLGQFNVRLHIRAIARAGIHVALLLSDEPLPTLLSDDDILEIQVRKVDSGHKVQVVESFEDEALNTISLDDPKCFLVNSYIYIGESQSIARFSRAGWLITDSEEADDDCIGIDDIRDLALDDEGNIYACSYNSNNIYQISRNNFCFYRIIIPYILNPVCIAFDSVRKRLIVGCDNSDYIHEYQFTN